MKNCGRFTVTVAVIEKEQKHDCNDLIILSPGIVDITHTLFQQISRPTPMLSPPRNFDKREAQL
jgi:hypothetical protein